MRYTTKKEELFSAVKRNKTIVKDCLYKYVVSSKEYTAYIREEKKRKNQELKDFIKNVLLA